MRILFASLIVAAVAAGSVGTAAAQRPGASAPAQNRWRTYISVCRRDVAPAASEVAQSAPRDGGFCNEDQLRGLILASDLPADLAQRSFDGRTGIELVIGENGEARECRIVSPSAQPRLDEIACPLIRRRGRFRPLHVAPLRPIATRWSMTVAWWITNEPPLPMMVPFEPAPPNIDQASARLRTWPRLFWPGGFEPVSLPQIQGDFPAAARLRNGNVSLDLVVTPEAGVRDCIIGVSSGDAALDAASCTAARRVELRYSQPCERCPSANVPLQIVWRRGGGSHIRFPLLWWPSATAQAPLRDPADERAAPAYLPVPVAEAFEVVARDYRLIADRTMTNTSFVATVGVDAAGRVTSCRPSRPTGNAEIDQRTCALIVDKARFRPRTDVFGDRVAGETRMRVILSRIG